MNELTKKAQEFYDAGRKARIEGRSIESCAGHGLVHQAWFKAGYHDQDYELGARIYNGPERARAGVSA